MNVISSSYGNDSMALIVLAYENDLKDVHVVFIDTGWASADWMARVDDMERRAKMLGFSTHRVTSGPSFSQIVRQKKGFPNQRYQWCSAMLKGIPFLRWLKENDPAGTATILIGKRRAESRERAVTPEHIKSSEFHGGRRIWHPLFNHSDAERNALLYRAGIEPLSYRSQECAPCVNANKADLCLLSGAEIERVRQLEQEVGKTMFRPKRHMGAEGIEEVIRWARSPRGAYQPAITEAKP